MEKEYILRANLDYVDGHLRYGYREMTLTKEQLEVFEKLPEEKQIEWLRDGGVTIVTDYEVNGYGGLDLESLSVEEVDK